MKKLLSSLICLALMLGVFSFNAYAETVLEKDQTYKSADGNYEYTLVNTVEGENWISIKKYIGEKLTGDLIVPDKIDGYRVVQIGKGAFEEQEMKSVKTLFTDDRHELKIGEAAFKSCAKLTEIDLAKMTSEIGTQAFMDCTALKTINEDGVVLIGNEAFKNCSAIEKVKFTSDYLKILPDAFNGCRKLTSADLSETANLYEKAIGFVNNKKTSGFVFNVRSSSIKSRDDLYTVQEYAAEYGFKTVYNMDTSLSSALYLSPGVQMTVKANGKKITGCKSSNPKAVKITSNGKLTVLNKGEATITYKTGGKKFSRAIVNKYSPKIDYKTIKVKKGSVCLEKITVHGKVSSINNKYYNTKTAKITSKKSSGTIRVKGLKKGKTTLKITVNGVKTLKLKVTVY